MMWLQKQACVYEMCEERHSQYQEKSVIAAPDSQISCKMLGKISVIHV